MAKPESYANFKVSSGSLCFGGLHNLHTGASVPVQEFPTSSPLAEGGTVVVQNLEYNVAALNGTWLAYKLIDMKANKTAGYFICHDSVDPEPEIDEILRVSGSPYEADSGSHKNDDNTRSNRILVINRYDWGY